jgi:flagellar hook-associated protein 2
VAGSLALSGLASGVDTSSIVDQLIALDRQGTTRLQLRQSSVTGMQSSLKTIATKLAALKTAANALNDSTSWKPTQTVSSSDSRVVVAQTGGAGIGGHSVQVNRLASSAQRGYSLPGGAAGTLTITNAVDGTNTMSVAVAADATVQQIADAINAKPTGPVVAAVVTKNGEQRLVLSSRTTGHDSDFTVSGGILTDDPAYTSPALAQVPPDPTLLDAEYSLDGGAPATSATNVLENAVPGLRLTLNGVTSSPAAVTVTEPALNKDAVKTKIKAFVDAYNSFVDTAQNELNEKPIANATNSTDAAQGQLYGDTGLSSMLNVLRRQMGNVLSGAGINDLGDLGVGIPASSSGVVSDDAKAGKLAINDTKLNAALDSNWVAVKDFFTGFSKTVSDYVDTQTGGHGTIDNRLTAADSNLKLLKDQYTEANARIDAKQERLKAQFAAMETALQNSQTQQAWLQGQLASLPTYR